MDKRGLAGVWDKEEDAESLPEKEPCCQTNICTNIACGVQHGFAAFHVLSLSSPKRRMRSRNESDGQRPHPLIFYPLSEWNLKYLNISKISEYLFLRTFKGNSKKQSCMQFILVFWTCPGLLNLFVKFWWPFLAALAALYLHMERTGWAIHDCQFREIDAAMRAHFTS